MTQPIAAAYGRKSTAQATSEEQKSIVRQIATARRFAAEKGWHLPEDHVFGDDAVSGALFERRAQFQAMLRAARAGTFQHLIVCDLDRLGRNSRKTMAALHDLADYGVTVWDIATGQAIDLDTMPGELMTYMRTGFAQEFRESIRRHTRAALRRKAEQGLVCGGVVFGYRNVRRGKGEVVREIDPVESAIVREIFERFASGESPRRIAEVLNMRGIASPRASKGSACGWSVSTVRAVLDRPLYSGIQVYGASKKAYGRELGRGATREKGQIATDASTWITVEVPHLRIVPADLAAKCSAMRSDKKQRYKASLSQRGVKMPERGTGKFLLSGGMLLCPDCGSHFELWHAPWDRSRTKAYYRCSQARRRPGSCPNALRLPMQEADDAILDAVDELVGDDAELLIEELCLLVGAGGPDHRPALLAEKARLTTERQNLIDLAAAGVSPHSLAPDIRRREAELASVEAQLRQTRVVPDLDQLREALQDRTSEWAKDLRKDPDLSRAIVRRVIAPITLRNPVDQAENTVQWGASVRFDALLAGVYSMLASPTGPSDEGHGIAELIGTMPNAA